MYSSLCVALLHDLSKHRSGPTKTSKVTLARTLSQSWTPLPFLHHHSWRAAWAKSLQQNANTRSQQRPKVKHHQLDPRSRKPHSPQMAAKPAFLCTAVFNLLDDTTDKIRILRQKSALNDGYFLQPSSNASASDSASDSAPDPLSMAHGTTINMKYEQRKATNSKLRLWQKRRANDMSTFLPECSASLLSQPISWKCAEMRISLWYSLLRYHTHPLKNASSQVRRTARRVFTVSNLL